MKEAEPLEYGKLTAKDYIPGAEILPETAEVEERQQEQGCTMHEEFSHSFNIAKQKCLQMSSESLLYDAASRPSSHTSLFQIK